MCQMGSACVSTSAAVADGQLVSGVGLHDPQRLLRNSPDRLALSRGVRSVSSLALSGYRDSAFVPRGPWRDPSSQERRLLLAAEPPESIGGHITLVRAPDEVMAQFGTLRERVHAGGSVSDVSGWLREHPCTIGCDVSQIGGPADGRRVHRLSGDWLTHGHNR